jgi:hypothetical protein
MNVSGSSNIQGTIDKGSKGRLTKSAMLEIMLVVSTAVTLSFLAMEM